MDYVICFLKILNENFNHVKSNILMVEPLPGVTKVFSPVLQQERQLNTKIATKFSKILFTNINNQQDNGKFQQKPEKSCGNYQGRCISNLKVCSFCGKHDHTLDTCYLKYGFPPGFKFKDKVRSSNNVESYDEDRYQNTHTNDHQETRLKSHLTSSFDLSLPIFIMLAVPWVRIGSLI